MEREREGEEERGREREREREGERERERGDDKECSREVASRLCSILNIATRSAV